MLKTYFATAVSTIVAMVVFAKGISFILYSLLYIFPILILALFVREFSTNSKIGSSRKFAISNTLIYASGFEEMGG